jgi:energy-coupling factor transporter ATP-binding protein EcfA2
MRLTGVSASGFLSFDDFSIELDPGLTVVVGPNGAGKSNLLRVPDLVLAGLSFSEGGDTEASAQLADVLEARHGGRADREVRLSVDLALTEPNERDLVTSFWQAAAYTALLQGMGGPENEDITSWVSEEITADRLSSLWEGTVSIAHAGHRDARWVASFEFDVSGTRYHWNVGHMSAPAHLVRASLPGTRTPARQDRLGRRLLGRDVTHPASAPEQPFALENVLPGDDEGIDIPIESPGLPVSALHRRFIDQHGLDPNVGNRSYTFGASLLTILRRGLVRVSDARLVPARQGEVPANRDAPTAEAELPTFLLGLKNGSLKERARYRDVCNLFASLARDRAMDVGLRPDGTAVARVSVGTDFEVPIEFAGSGAWELLVLASTLGHAEGSVVLLDEPAASFHPTLQRVLIERLSQAAGQVVVVTHSPYLLPLSPDRGGARLLRIVREGLASRAYAIASSELMRVSRKLRSKGNQGIPFAERVILCEGEDDVAVIRILAERRSLLVGERNVLVVDCGGRENLPDYVRLCTGLGLPHLVVMDRDSTKAAAEPEIATRVHTVEEAVEASGNLGSLFAFSEDVEAAFGLSRKGRRELERTAGEVSLGGADEPGRLSSALVAFLHAGETPAADPGSRESSDHQSEMS